MQSSPTKAQIATERAIKFFEGEYQLAAAIGVSQPTVNRWRRGTRKPGRKVDALLRLERKTDGLIRVVDFLD